MSLPGTARRPSGDAAPLGALFALYVVSRLAAWQAGVRFDLSTLDISWQILDPALLRHDLLASLLHMPGQPPLYNLALGAVLKLADVLGFGPVGLAGLFRCLYGALALVSIALFHALLRRAEVGPWRAATVVAVFALSPAMLLYETVPYYTLMVLAWLLFIAWCFQRCLHAPTFGRASLLFMAMAGLIWTRSLFQIEWMTVLVLFTALLAGRRWRLVLLAALAPLALVLVLYAKNVALIGEFSTSDWMGLSLAKMTTLRLDHDRRAALVAAGDLSPLALSDNAYDLGPDDIRRLGGAPHTGQPVLDDRHKSTGAVNYNYRLFAPASEQATRDALATIRMAPGVYAEAVGTAWLMFWRPASDYPLIAANRRAIRPWAWLYAKLVAGQPRYPETPQFALEAGRVGWFIAAGYLVAVVFGFGVALRCLVRRRISRTDSLLLFVWLNVLYVSVIGNALEIDENQRFRFAVEPFIALLLVVAVRRGFERLPRTDRSSEDRQETD